MEDKANICRLLLGVLQQTRQCRDLVELEYINNDGDEYVNAVFACGSSVPINVTADSGIAMILDITKSMY